MDASLPFEFLTEPAVSNAQNAAVEAGTVDPGASVPRRLKPRCSLIQFDDNIMGLSANSATSYLPLVVFGIDRPGGIRASQLQANEPFGHRQRRQIGCYSRGGNRPGRSAPSTGGCSPRRQQQQQTCRRVRRAQASPTRAPTANTLRTLQAIAGQKLPERSITYPAQPPRVEAEPGWDRVEKTRPTAHSTKRETLHHPQLKSPSAEGGEAPLGDPETGGGEGGEGGTPCGFFPKEKNERGGTPCHDMLVLFCVTLARGSAEGGKIGRPPPHHPAAKSGPVYAIQGSTADHGSAYDKVPFTKNSLERKNLAPSRHHAQNSTLYLTSNLVFNGFPCPRSHGPEDLGFVGLAPEP